MGLNIGQFLIVAGARTVCQWEPENYPHLCSPLSPCLTLQWTYRDNNIVNLPWALLVAGDIIVVKPGQQIPGYCTPYEVSTNTATFVLLPRIW